MITNPHAVIDLINYEAQRSISFSSSPNKSFASIDKLSSNVSDSPHFMTFSLNQSMLDSSLDYNKSNISFMSEALSDENCLFDNVWVRAGLDKNYDFYAITISFGLLIPKRISIDYFDSFGNIVDNEVIDNITSNTIFSQKSQFSVKSILVSFVESYFPYQYASMQYFAIGAILKFDRESIADFQIQEHTDIISSKLEISTATLDVYSRRNDYDILDYKNISNFVLHNQKVVLSVDIINDDTTETLFLGNYYVDNISFVNLNVVRFNLYSLLGIMEKVDYWLSPFSSGSLKISDFILSIFECVASALNVEPSSLYRIDTSVEDAKISGYIPKMSCRDALQQICFVNSLCVLDNRNDKIIIKNVQNDIISKKTIKSSYIFNQPSFDVMPTKSNAFITAFSFSLEQDEEIVAVIDEDCIFNFKKPIDTSTISFDHSSGFTYKVSATCLNLKFTGTPFELVVYAKSFSNTSQSFYTGDNISSYESLTISDSFLVSDSNFSELADNVINFFSDNSIKLNLEYLCQGQATGDFVLVQLDDKEFYGNISYQTLNISSGMTARAEVLGSNHLI